MSFFFKQKTADEMRISDWSSDVCSSELSAVSSGTVASLDTVVTTGPLVLAKGTSALGIGAVDTASASLSAGSHSLTVTQASAGATRRSEERREGKEGVRTCRSRWSPFS